VTLYLFMTRLFLDAMLGRLATYLRMCGYDAAYALDEGVEADEAVLERARETDRTLVTRDRRLAERSPKTILLASREVTNQLAELADAGLTLDLPASPEQCGGCNGALVGVGPQEPTPEYAPDPVAVDVWRCPDCGQHFWKGSHWDDVAETLAGIE
jgi:uncharacterized protein with PIN domain